MPTKEPEIGNSLPLPLPKRLLRPSLPRPLVSPSAGWTNPGCAWRAPSQRNLWPLSADRVFRRTAVPPPGRWSRPPIHTNHKKNRSASACHLGLIKNNPSLRQSCEAQHARESPAKYTGIPNTLSTNDTIAESEKPGGRALSTLLYSFVVVYQRNSPSRVVSDSPDMRLKTAL